MDIFERPLVGYCAVMGKPLIRNFGANRFTFRGGVSDLNLYFVYFYILLPQPGLSGVKCDHTYWDSKTHMQRIR